MGEEMKDRIELLEAKVKMLTTALLLCKTLLDALRLDSNIGSYLLTREKETFEHVDAMATKALEMAKR